MKTKICSRCKQEKPLIEFTFRKDKNAYRAECKKCRANTQRSYARKNRSDIYFKRDKYYKDFPWMQTLRAIKQRCNNPKASDYKYYGGKGVECLITADELKELWFRDRAFEMTDPTIDRKNSNDNYYVENCRYYERVDNSKRKGCRIILQFDKQGNFIKEWISISEAGRFINRSISSLSDALQNRSTYCAGFIWKYKDLTTTT
jgi:hypothetical protein